MVTGTGTDVGKTIVTAAVAAVAAARGERVAVLKPAQTGIAPGEPGDLAVVDRLMGGAVTTRELGRFPEPLAPLTAARRAGMDPVTPRAAVAAARELDRDHDLVLVEGAGGLLVRFTADGTLADVATGLGAAVLVVAAAGLGTLNHTELTTRALQAAGLACAGIVVGSLPATPDLATTCNLTDLPEVTGIPLVGALPEGAGALGPEQFATVARHSLGAPLGGKWQTPQP